MRIATLGPKGTFSEEAALVYQQRTTGRAEPGRIKFFSIPECLQQVESYKADRAVLPAENMVDGIIGITFDSLIEFHDFVKVCDEVHVQIKYVLAGGIKSLGEVEKSIPTRLPSTSACTTWRSCSLPGPKSPPVPRRKRRSKPLRSPVPQLYVRQGQRKSTD